MASKSRRRPRGRAGREQGRGGRRGVRITPTLVLLIGGGVVAALVAAFVLFGGGSDGSQSTALPGEYVDIPEIYGGPYPETAGHVATAIDYDAVGNSNPPTGGPHWSGSCGEDPTEAPAICGPAPWGVFREPWAPQTLVHNMEHAGVVVWYNTGDQDIIDSLEALVTDRLRSDANLVVMTPYAGMEDDTIALTSWTRIDKFSITEYTDERAGAFIDTHVRRFNPEGS